MDTPTLIMLKILMIGFQWELTSSSLAILLFRGIPRSNPILLGPHANLNIEPLPNVLVKLSGFGDCWMNLEHLL